MKSSEERYIAIPRQLQLGDPLFTIVAFPLFDDAKPGDPLAKVEWFDVQVTTVESLERDPQKTNYILINKKVSLLADGELNDTKGVILNESDARKAVITMYDKESNKLDDLNKRIQQAKKSFDKALVTFKNKTLNREPIDVHLEVPAGSKVIIDGSSMDD
jgi:hypothetical protein